MGLASCVAMLLLVLMGMLWRKAFMARKRNRTRTESALRRLENVRMEEISAPVSYPEEIYAEPRTGPPKPPRLGHPRRLDMDVSPSPDVSLTVQPTSDRSTVRFAAVTVERRDDGSPGPSPLLSFSPPVSTLKCL